VRRGLPTHTLLAALYPSGEAAVLDEFDPFLRWGRICEALGGCSRRTLYDMVKRGDFPPPDRPAKCRGEAALWRTSTVRIALENYANKPPTRGGVAPPSTPRRRAKPSR